MTVETNVTIRCDGCGQPVMGLMVTMSDSTLRNVSLHFHSYLCVVAWAVGMNVEFHDFIRTDLASRVQQTAANAADARIDNENGPANEVLAAGYDVQHEEAKANVDAFEAHAAQIEAVHADLEPTVSLIMDAYAKAGD